MVTGLGRSERLTGYWYVGWKLGRFDHGARWGQEILKLGVPGRLLLTADAVFTWSRPQEAAEVLRRGRVGSGHLYQVSVREWRDRQSSRK